MVDSSDGHATRCSPSDPGCGHNWRGHTGCGLHPLLEATGHSPSASCRRRGTQWRARRGSWPRGLHCAGLDDVFQVGALSPVCRGCLRRSHPVRVGHCFLFSCDVTWTLVFSWSAEQPDDEIAVVGLRLRQSSRCKAVVRASSRRAMLYDCCVAIVVTWVGTWASVACEWRGAFLCFGRCACDSGTPHARTACMVDLRLEHCVCMGQTEVSQNRPLLQQADQAR